MKPICERHQIFHFDPCPLCAHEAKTAMPEPEPSSEGPTCSSLLAEPVSSAAGFGESLVAAIEGNLGGMSKDDLILTCKMLERGREVWRKEAEAAKELLDWAESLICNAVPISHFTQDEWNVVVKKWRDAKHGVGGGKDSPMKLTPLPLAGRVERRKDFEI